MHGFDIVETQNGRALEPDLITKPNNVPTEHKTNEDITSQKLDLAAKGFDSIMKLATDITEIRKMKTQGELLLQKMDKDREMLLSEAQAYAERRNADTKSVVDRMNVIRGMMQDFYAQSNQQITGEDFRVIITEIVNQMGRVANGE